MFRVYLHTKHRIYLNLTKTLGGRNYYTHFTNKRTKAQAHCLVQSISPLSDKAFEEMTDPITYIFHCFLLKNYACNKICLMSDFIVSIIFYDIQSLRGLVS